MANTELIKKTLPEHLWEIAEWYTIQDSFLESQTELIVMILESKSIDTVEEKQNWFNLLPLMNEEQVEKLRGILIKEKTKLQEIEDKYEKKKQDIKDKYMKKRDKEGYSEKVKELKTNEKKVTEKDMEDAEDLLEMI